MLQIVHKKTASVLCLTTVKNEDKMDFSRILEAIKVSTVCIFNYIITRNRYNIFMDILVSVNFVLLL